MSDPFLLKVHTIEYVKYSDMVDHIKAKYKINERDYAGKFADTERTKIGEAAILEATGKSVNEWIKELGHSNPKWIELNKFYPPDLSDKIPYQDFWHFMLDYWDGYPFNKGKPLPLNWLEVADYTSNLSWQHEIACLYVHEFGDEDYTVIADW